MLPSCSARTALAATATLACLWLAGCASTPAGTSAAPNPVAAPPAAAASATAADNTTPRPGAAGRVAGRSDKLLVYLPAPGDQLEAIAERFLGQAALAWRIADADGQRWEPDTLRPMVIPLQAGSALGINSEGVQTVPILCYHRFGAGASKMLVAPATFEAQLEWLARNHYTVLKLSDLSDFLAGKQALPQRSVVITIDDGYESVHRYAWPLLKKYGFTATLFVYPDFIDSRDGLSWAQLQQMAESGVIDIQSHSKSHRNLIERKPGENDASYRTAMDLETRQPRVSMERRLAGAGVKVRHFAYPFGDANEVVLDAVQRQSYELAATVNPGGNAFYAQPLMLRRTMIFGDYDIEAFKQRLQIRRPLNRP